ncbi:MAG TPA: oxidoreductase [Verrucomicrobiae bacterium]|nr:oxidoreductase [Verrucomicrobiae bacterium]
MPEKPKIAFYWCASCGGCEESVVDLAEDILMVVENVDIVFWPVAMDFKKKDVEAMPDGSITACFLNGAIRTEEQEEMAHMLRRKAKILIAYGACAHLGGIPALANQFSKEHVMEWAYDKCPTVTNPSRTRPQTSYKDNGRTATLPAFRNVVRALDQVVDVDYYIPGCAPTPALLKGAVVALLSGKLPPKGTTLAPDIALCDECPRKASKPTDVGYPEFKRPHLARIDPNLCMLAQGFVCMGPATRGGCGALCINGNMPCTGCFGPTSRVRDQGAKILSSICSSVAPKDEAGIDAVLEGIPDPVGTFYRYGLAHCLLRRKVSLNDSAEVAAK